MERSAPTGFDRKRLRESRNNSGTQFESGMYRIRNSSGYCYSAVVNSSIPKPVYAGRWTWTMSVSEPQFKDYWCSQTVVKVVTSKIRLSSDMVQMFYE
jgi:hypothetical protein